MRPSEAADLFEVDLDNYTADDINKMFRKLALFYHPDKSKDPNATQRMVEVNNAKDMLLGMLQAPRDDADDDEDYNDDNDADWEEPSGYTRASKKRTFDDDDRPTFETLAGQKRMAEIHVEVLLKQAQAERRKRAKAEKLKREAEANRKRSWEQLYSRKCTSV
jgi:DnaJ-class molecular chaperone